MQDSCLLLSRHTCTFTCQHLYWTQAERFTAGQIIYCHQKCSNSCISAHARGVCDISGDTCRSWIEVAQGSEDLVPLWLVDFAVLECGARYTWPCSYLSPRMAATANNRIQVTDFGGAKGVEDEMEEVSHARPQNSFEGGPSLLCQRCPGSQTHFTEQSRSCTCGLAGNCLNELGCLVTQNIPGIGGHLRKRLHAC